MNSALRPDRQGLPNVWLLQSTRGPNLFGLRLSLQVRCRWVQELNVAQAAFGTEAALAYFQRTVAAANQRRAGAGAIVAAGDEYARQQPFELRRHTGIR